MVLTALLGISKDQLDQLQRIPFDQTVLTWIENETGEDGGSGMQMMPAALQIHRFLASTHTPLHARGGIQGLLSCYRQLEIPFNPYQVTFLKAIGEQVSIAVENHRLRMKVKRTATLQERQRLARELHDAVSQSLYSLTLYARSGRDAFEAGDRDKLVDSLERLEENALMALKEMRLLLYQLRSLALGEGGLEKAIEARFNLVERRSGIQASLDVGDGIQLTENIEQELFRLITEALNNALKHARANQVAVTLQLESEHIILEVCDNGQGFDQEQVQAGMGLLNMRERALALGGCFEVHSQMGNGTRIRIEIPGLRDTTEEDAHGQQNYRPDRG
jgi:signal transduction histidine kinase